MPAVFPVSRQKGATFIFVALWMGVVLAGLMVLDIGNLVWQKRELQKIADLSAIAGASDVLERCDENALAFASENGLRSEDPSPSIHAGNWVAKTDFDAFLSTAAKNACGIKVSRVVPYFFVWPASAGGARTLSAEAIAVQQLTEIARLFIRNKVLDIATGKPNAVLLNAVVGGLLGGSLNLSVASWEGLLRTDLKLLSFLEALAIELKLDAGNYNGLLETDVDVGTLVAATIRALQEEGDATAAANISALQAIKVAAAVRPLKFKLAQLLQLDLSGTNAGLDTRLNVFGLLQSVIQVGNKNAAVDANLKIPLGPLADVNLKLKVIEPPQWAVGIPSQNPPLQARTAQVQLGLDATVLGIGVKLDVNAGSGSVTLTNYDCRSLDSKSLSVDVRSALLALSLKLKLLNSDVVSVPLELLSQTRSANITPPELTRADAAPPSDIDEAAWQTVVFNTGIVKSLTDSVKKTLQETLKSSLGFLGSLLGGLLGGVLDLVNLVVSPILDPILSLLLTMLGIDITATEYAGQLTCGGYRATLVY